MTDHHRGGSTGDTRHVVMLCQPVALVTETLGMLRQLLAVLERLRSIAALIDRGKIENGKRNHAWS